MTTRWTASAWLSHAARHMQTHERQWLDEANPPSRVGELELATIQQRAVARAGRALALYGGVILADGTGMGKTRVALALIARFLRRHGAPARAMVCVPARLRPMWTRALARASQGRSWAERVVIVTHHACSHKGVEAWTHPRLPALVVIDEAHRIRTPSSRRYDTVAKLARHAAGVICITASPVCNGTEDLAALVELFRARGWSTSRMGRLVGEDLSGAWQSRTFEMLAREVIVRRTHLALGGDEVEEVLAKPRQRIERLTYEPGAHEQWVWQNLGEMCKRLERALFAGRWGEGLLVELMWRRWESGAEALWRTLHRLLVWHERALAHHARAGTCIGARELRRVFDGEQEVFGFLLDEEIERAGQPAAALDIEAIARDEAILRELFERVSQARAQAFSAHSGGRIHALCEYLSRAHSGQKVLCFTSSVEAAEGCFDALRARQGGLVSVGLMTGSGARVTGLGPRPPQEVLERFAPIGQECQGLYPPSAQIDVLVATDCIAEGVNLQDCACVVLLDLPYSPLGLAQRVGRFVRPGSPHEEVVVVWLRPARWQDSLGMRRRLDQKALAAARAHVGYGDLCDDLFSVSREPEPDTVVSGSGSLDRFERLWRSAVASGVEGEISLMYRCDTMAGVWGSDSCVVWVREGSEALGWRHTWWRLAASGEVCHVASEHVAELVTWMESGDEATLEVHDDARWRARIERAVLARQRDLQGLWWAPIQVRKGSVAQRALEVLRDVEGGEQVCLALATLPLSEGLSRVLAEKLDQGLVASALSSWLAQEFDAMSVWRVGQAHTTHPPRVEWLSAVYTSPDESP